MTDPVDRSQWKTIVMQQYVSDQFMRDVLGGFDNWVSEETGYRLEKMGWIAQEESTWSEAMIDPFRSPPDSTRLIGISVRAIPGPDAQEMPEMTYEINDD